jgi:large conductance mechanosensitive channel
MRNTLNEFKNFINKGNVVGLAVGIIIGAEFNKIVGSLVEDMIMPVVGSLTGGINFSNMYIALSSNIPNGMPLVEAKKIGAVLAYGNFLTLALNFIIIAFAVFWIVKIATKAGFGENQKS